MDFLISISTQTTEYRFLPANQPEKNFKLFCKRKKDHEYHVHYGEGIFYVLSNKDKAYNYKLMQVPETDLSEQESSYPSHLWEETIPHRREVFLQELEVFKGFIALHSRKNCREEIEVYDLKNPN